MLSASSRVSSARNRSLSDMSLPVNSSVREFGGFFPPPGIDASHSQSVLSNHLVSTLFFPSLVAISSPVSHAIQPLLVLSIRT
jgi:hypothetical protein